METFTPNVSPPIGVPLVIPQFDNMLEQQSNILNPLDEHVSNEPTKNEKAINEQMIPQEIVLRWSARKKKNPAISNDYVVYSLEHKCDLSVDKDLVSFKQAIECHNSENWINVMKEELKSMDDNKVWDLVEFFEGSKQVNCK